MYKTMCCSDPALAAQPPAACRTCAYGLVYTAINTVRPLEFTHPRDAIFPKEQLTELTLQLGAVWSAWDLEIDWNVWTRFTRLYCNTSSLYGLQYKLMACNTSLLLAIHLWLTIPAHGLQLRLSSMAQADHTAPSCKVSSVNCSFGKMASLGWVNSWGRTVLIAV